MYPKHYDPIAAFEKAWPTDQKPLNATMAALRKVQKAGARKCKALQDLENAMRDLFEAEAELEFIKSISKRKH